MYEYVRVVTPVLHSDHNSLIAGKVTEKKLSIRQVTLAQQQRISTLDFDISHHSSIDTQSLFDSSYDSALQLINS